MSLDIIADPVTHPTGSPLVDSSNSIKMDSDSENAPKMEVDGTEVRMEKEMEASVKCEPNDINLGRSASVAAAVTVTDGALTEQRDQPPVREAKEELSIYLENRARDERKSIIISESAATNEKIKGETDTVIQLNDTSSLPPISSTSEISAAISPPATSDAIPMTALEARSRSPLPAEAQPVPFPASEVPSLLLRMGPPVAEFDAPISTALPIEAPGSPTKALPQRPLPDRSLMDRPLSKKPVVDTWFPDEEVRNFQPRKVTDTYIAPRSPSPGRSSMIGRSSIKRRLEHSPPRTFYQRNAERDRRNSRTEDGPRRESTRRDSWRDEHLPAKRYKAEVEDSIGRLPNKQYTAEARDFTENGHATRGDSWRPGDEDRTDQARWQGRTQHDDNRSRHRRSPSVDRRSNWGTRDFEIGRRNHRSGGKRSPSVERKSDWGTRGVSDRGRDYHEDDTRHEKRHRDGPRETNDHRDARSRPSELSARTTRDADIRKSERDDDDYNKRSNGYSRTREYVEAQRQPTRKSQPGHRTADTADHPPRSAGLESSGWDRSSSKQHEGRQTESTRSSHRSPSRQNGRETFSSTTANGTTNATEHTTNETGRESIAAGAIRSPPPKAQQQIPTGPRPRSNQQAAPLQAPVGNGDAPQNKPVTTGGWSRTALNGANSIPVDTRRGYEAPKVPAPAGPSPSSSSFTPHARKDTFTPPLQDKEYILAKYAAQKHLVKSVWIDNPKAPVANFLTGGRGGANGLGPRGPAYRVTMGRLGGINMARATLPIRGHPSIVGTGDDPVRVQAEKLACLSALFQLAEAGLVKCEEQPVEAPPLELETMDIDDADSEEVTQLSTGETITLKEARAFMDYYCKRFGFGQPEISYETVAMRSGPQKWEAIMEVGGKKIGLGAGTTKKMATRVCYLDVTSYLEKCDQELWKEYVEHAKGQAA